MPHMTVLDNTAFGMELAGINAEERREKALMHCVRSGWKIMPTATRMNSLAGCVNVWD